MFTIGDKVVYPMHGAGIIQAIEEKEVLGETRAYFVMRIPYGNIQVMVPIKTYEQAGLRAVVEPEYFDKVMEALSAESTPMDDNWNRRLRDNNEKLKTGDPVQVAEVIRNLTRVEREKKLSAGEKKLLTTARQILASEMVLVQDISEEEAMERIDKAI